MHPYLCAPCGTRYPGYVSPCPACWAAHGVVLDPQGTKACVDAEPRVMTAQELISVRHPTFEIPAYPDLVVGDGALVVAVGPRGAGKSTLVARALASILAPTLLMSVEEPPGASLAARLVLVGADHDRMQVIEDASFNQLANLVRKHRIVAVGVDSQQRSSLTPRDLRRLLRTLPSLAVVFAVSQVNRGGDVRGGEELPHEADVVIDVCEMRWSLSKSRYQRIDWVGGEVLQAPEQEET